MDFEKYKGLICVFFSAIIILSGLILFNIKKAEAAGVEAALAVPVGELYSVPGEAKEGLYGAGFGWDTIGYIAAKIALSSMTNSIVNWINSGFEGGPTFVTNPSAYFQDMADQATGVFIHQLGIEGILCSQFRPQIIASLKYSVPSMGRFQCTLSAAVDNWEGFMDDFTAGGWKGWLSVSTQPQNNPYGAYLMAVDELEQRRAEAKENAKTEVSWGSGFISLKKCVGGKSQEDSCSGQCDNSIGNYGEEDADWNQCHSDCMAEQVSASQLCEDSGGSMQNTTPGTIIADQLKLNLGSSVRQMELADEISESLGAIFNALINQLITKGISSLSNTGGNSGSKGWYESSPTTNEKNDALKIIDNTLIYEKQYRDAKQNTLGLFNDIIANLEELKQCYKDQIYMLKFKVPVNQIKIDLLQNKIDYEIQPEINDYKNKKAPFEKAAGNSNWIIGKAEEIRLDIINAYSYNEMNGLIDEYIREIQPVLHTILDAQDAQREYETIKGQIDTEDAKINAEYIQCFSDLSNL